MEIRSGVFNLNKLTKECKDYKMKVEKDWLPENLRNRQDLKKIGYPRIEYHSNLARYNKLYVALYFINKRSSVYSCSFSIYYIFAHF